MLKSHLMRLCKLALAVSMVITTLNVSLTVVDASPYLSLDAILSTSELPVINVSIENGEDVNRVEKESSNIEFEIYNTNGKGKDFKLEKEVADDGTITWPATIKGRGNSSWTMPTNKKPYNIKFESKQDLLGFGKAKKWCLIAAWPDTSFVRTYLAYKLAKELDSNAPDCEIVNLCINGEYEGIYLLCEAYEIKSNRVETAGDGQDINNDGEITQFLIEADSRAVENNEPNRFETTSGIWMVTKEPDEDEIVSSDDSRYTYITDYLNQVDEAIVNLDNYEDYIDVDSLIDLYLVNEFAKNPDFGFGNQPCYSSTFMYMEEGGKLYFGPAWDFDIAFGRNDYGDQAAEGYRDTYSPEGFLTKNTQWISQLFEDPIFEQKVKERWTEIQPIIENLIYSVAPEAIQKVSSSQAYDFATWESAQARTVSWNYRTPLEFEEESAWVVQFMIERTAWLNSQWNVSEKTETHNLEWFRSEITTPSEASYSSLINSPSTLVTTIWDGGYGSKEQDGTEEINYGESQTSTDSTITLETPITITGPKNNVCTWFKDDDSLKGGFGGSDNSITITSPGRYIYSNATKIWWFNSGNTYTMGENGNQIYVVDVSANGSVTVSDGQVTPSDSGRLVVTTDTNYSQIDGNDYSFTLSYKEDQSGNAGQTISGNGSVTFNLSLPSAYPGQLEIVLRQESSIYDEPLSIQSTYIYIEGPQVISWEITNKETGELDDSIISFDETTRKVSAKGNGTAIITAYTEDGYKATVEITSICSTSSETKTVEDTTKGIYNDSYTGIAQEQGNWATLSPQKLTHFSAQFEVDEASYTNATSFFLGTRQMDEIIGGEANYYVYVNGQPFFLAGNNSLNSSEFSDDQIISIENDQDDLSSYVRYSYMNGIHAHLETINNNLKNLLTSGTNQIDIFVDSENGSAINRPYLFSSYAFDDTETPEEPTTIPVTSVTLSKTELELTEGESETITATINPSDASDKSLTWTSSNEEVATVNNGTITAVSAGNTTITATTSNNLTATVNVTVNEKVIPVTSVTLSKTELELTEGESETITATINPSDASDKSLTWSSSNEEVATVNNGTITAISAGTATITVTTSNNLTATVNVTVNEKIIPVTSVTLSKTELTLTEGDIETITATINPSDATDQSLTWSSSNEEVATVNNGTITAISAGTATITATTSNNLTATVNITVNEKTIPVTSVTLSKTELELTEGESETITATINPSDATDQSLTWTSSNEEVATVNNGTITAISAGTATITVTTSNGLTASTNVTVKENIILVSSISVSTLALTLSEDETSTIIATVSPSNATNTSLEWTSSNPNVATVDNGLVTAISAGTTTITVSTLDGSDLSATILVTIKENIIPVASVTLSKTELTLTEGETETITATINPSDATDQSLTWTSSNEEVATVNDGTITAISAGTATITATTSNNLTATVSVTVNEKIIPVTSVTLSKTELTLTEGDSETITATINPSDATDQSLTWSSSNEEVATVNNGTITAVSAGNTTITVTTSNNLTATINVTVNEKVIPVTSVTLSKSELTLTEGDSETITATINPSDATNKSLTWSSSNEEVATVNNGTITAISAGTATITVTTSNNLTATINVTVNEKVIPVTSVTLSKTELELTEGETETITATINPSDATDQSLTWSSSNEEVATVNNGTITAISAGTATITVTTSNGLTASTIVTVKENIVLVSSISVSTLALTLSEDETSTITATVSPSNATNPSLEWTSSNPNVATVDKGLVTAISAGTTTITVSTLDGSDLSATIIVTVNKKVIPVTSITLSKTELTLIEGDSEIIKATINPSDATDQSLTWSSSNEEVATVNNGTITAVSAGTATITVTTSNNLTATIDVIVESDETPSEDNYLAPTYDTSVSTYASGTILYNPEDGNYYVYTNPWSIAWTNSGSLDSQWTLVTTDLTNIPVVSGLMVVNKGEIVKVGDYYYTPIYDGSYSHWISQGSSNAWWSMLPTTTTQNW